MKYVKTYESFLNEKVAFNTEIIGRDDWDTKIIVKSREVLV